MGKIFINQNALQFKAYCGEDITGAISTLIKFKKPDDTAGNFIATIEDATEGIIYYNVIGTNEIDQIGTWIMWSYIVFSDGRIAEGEPVKVSVYTAGEII